MTGPCAEPAPHCPRCPRLCEFRRENAAAHADWHNGPVPSFGPLSAELLVIGLAPGLRGANRTGRPFTGDYAGDLLFPTLHKFGFAHGTYEARAGDGLKMSGARITNAVRCVPPQNKPLPDEARNCRPFLEAEIATMTQLRVILALGVVAHQQAIRALGCQPGRFRFGHGVWHDMPAGRPLLVNSYHCSRYNTNTGRLTSGMFDKVFQDIRQRLKA